MKRMEQSVYPPLAAGSAGSDGGSTSYDFNLIRCTNQSSHEFGTSEQHAACCDYKQSMMFMD